MWLPSLVLMYQSSFMLCCFLLQHHKGSQLPCADRHLRWRPCYLPLCFSAVCRKYSPFSLHRCTAYSHAEFFQYTIPLYCTINCFRLAWESAVSGPHLKLREGRAESWQQPGTVSRWICVRSSSYESDVTQSLQQNGKETVNEDW